MANKNYKRRIMWTVLVDGMPSHVAIVEYMGQHIECVPHRLCKDKTVSEPYTPMPSETMEPISSIMKQQSAKMVYNKLTTDLDIDVAPPPLLMHSCLRVLKTLDTLGEYSSNR